MKKMMVIIVLVFVLVLTGCRRKFLDAPDEMKVPDGSLVAVCNDNSHTYTFVYQLDGVYLYYIDDILQSMEVTDSIQEQAFLHGESVENYLQSTFNSSQCIINDYVE